MPRAASIRDLLLPALAAAAATRAQPVIYDENSQGDLSNDRFHPTPLTLPIGEGLLLGALDGDVGGSIDRDYYTITIPQGYALSQIILQQYFSNDPVAFIAIQPGSIFPNDPATVQPGDLMGWLHFGPEDLGLDLLSLMGANGQGFTPPIGPGPFSFWTQQTGEPTTYVMDFVVAAPAPATLPLLLSAATPLLRRKRRAAVRL
jgi:hypothetical protein